MEEGGRRQEGRASRKLLSTLSRASLGQALSCLCGTRQARPLYVPSTPPPLPLHLPVIFPAKLTYVLIDNRPLISEAQSEFQFLTLFDGHLTHLNGYHIQKPSVSGRARS